MFQREDLLTKKIPEDENHIEVFSAGWEGDSTLQGVGAEFGDLSKSLQMLFKKFVRDGEKCSGIFYCKEVVLFFVSDKKKKKERKKERKKEKEKKKRKKERKKRKKERMKEYKK